MSEGFYTFQPDDAPRVTLLRDHIENGDTPTPELEADSWTPINLTTLPDQPPIKPTLGSTGLIYPGKRHVFSGPPESAKTLAAYTVAITVIRQGGTLILIDFEMGAYDARHRLTELGATPDEISHIHYLEPDTPATEPRISQLVELKPQLVLVDAAAGAYSLQGLDDNKRADVEQLANLYIRSFWRAGIASIFIDHVVKNAEMRGKFSIGSERKLGAADVHIGFETITPIQRGKDGLYKLTTHKDRGGYLQRGHLANLALTSDAITHQIGWTYQPADHTPDTQFRPTLLMERVSVFLSTQPEPVSRNTVEEAVKGHNAKAKRTALDVLIHEHFVTETAGPRGARLVQNIRLYNQDNPDHNPQNEATSSTSSDLVPTSSDEDETTSSTSSPPYRGTDDGRDEVKSPTSSSQQATQTSWIDELAYLESIADVDLDITYDPPES